MSEESGSSLVRGSQWFLKTATPMSVFYALLGTLFTWGMTAAGAALVFVFPSALKYRTLQQKLLDGRWAP